MRTRLSRSELFFQKVQKTDTCWLWTASLNEFGYGKFGTGGGGWVLAHRWIYEQTRGTIAPGMTLDHLCRVRRCVNPAHLEEVSLPENQRRGTLRDYYARKRARTHCKHGHEYTPENIRWFGPDKQHRACIACIRFYKRGYRMLRAMGRA